LQSPKRKAFHSFADDRDSFAGQDLKRPRSTYYEDDLVPRVGHMQVSRPIHSNSHQPMDVHSRNRVQPQQEYIDLTSSPRRPPTNGDNRYHVPAHVHAVAGSSGLSYVPITSRRSPVREVRGALSEAHSGEPSRAYMTNSGIYERRAPPVRDYFPVRDEQHRRPIDGAGAQYLRSGLQYGGPNVH
jgi:hypothetical protein